MKDCSSEQNVWCSGQNCLKGAPGLSVGSLDNKGAGTPRALCLCLVGAAAPKLSFPRGWWLLYSASLLQAVRFGVGQPAFSDNSCKQLTSEP